MRNEQLTDEDFLVVQQHAVDLNNGLVGGFLRLKVHKTIPLGGIPLVSSNLCGR